MDKRIEQLMLDRLADRRKEDQERFFEIIRMDDFGPMKRAFGEERQQWFALGYCHWHGLLDGLGWRKAGQVRAWAKLYVEVGGASLVMGGDQIQAIKLTSWVEPPAHPFQQRMPLGPIA